MRGGALWLTNCTLAWNQAGDGGEGGIRYITPGVPQGQAQGGAGGDGGGVASWHTNVTVASCTLAWNGGGTGGFGGLVIYPNPGPDGKGGGMAAGTAWQAGILNSLIAANSGSTPDVSGTFVSLGHNLVGMTNGANGFVGAGDRTGSTNAPIDPRLGALGDEGGITWTIPLLPGSPAIDAGASGAPGTDQRGVARPQGATPDIGAFEFLFSVPSFTSATFVSPGAFALQLRGLPDQTYAVESSTNLVQWTEVTSVVTGSDGLKDVVDGNLGPAPSRCYRLRWLAP
jgi:hypothetical protein